MNAVLQSLSNIPKIRDYLSVDLLPAGETISLGNHVITRTDTIDCFHSVQDKNLINTLSENEMFVFFQNENSLLFINKK